jgi:hypothetical protein
MQFAIKLDEYRRGPSIVDEGETRKELAGEFGILRVYWSAKEGIYSVLVMELLGPSLEGFNYCDRRFVLKIILFIAIQVIFLN